MAETQLWQASRRTSCTKRSTEEDGGATGQGLGTGTQRVRGSGGAQAGASSTWLVRALPGSILGMPIERKTGLEQAQTAKEEKHAEPIARSVEPTLHGQQAENGTMAGVARQEAAAQAGGGGETLSFSKKPERKVPEGDTAPVGEAYATTDGLTDRKLSYMAEGLGDQKAGTLTRSFEVPFGADPVKQAVSRVPLFNSEGGTYDTPDAGLSAIARVDKEKPAAHTVPASKGESRQGHREQRERSKEEHTRVHRVAEEGGAEQPQGASKSGGP